VAKNPSLILSIGIAGICLFVAACTSLKTVEMSSDELQQRIRAGEIMGEGDRVRIVTADREYKEILVTGVDETSVHGKKPARADTPAHGMRPVEGEAVSIPIDGILAVETREFSVGKTAVASGSIYYLFIAIMGAMAAAAL